MTAPQPEPSSAPAAEPSIGRAAAHLAGGEIRLPADGMRPLDDDASTRGDRIGIPGDTPSLPGDGGVLNRLRRRTAGASAVPLVVGAVLAVSGWAWPAWFAGLGGSLLGGLAVLLCLLAAGVLLRRSLRWRDARAESDAWVRGWASAAVSARAVPEGWAKAVCATGVPLHSGRGAIPMLRRERRFRSGVLPLKAVSGPLAGGDAVVVHARADGAMPARGDQLQVLMVQRRGPILIGRLEDGAVFAADRWSVGVG